MDIDFLARARSLAPELTALRHEIHRFPEPGNAEERTAALIEKTLRALGIEAYRPFGTAVVGVLRGALPGPCAASCSTVWRPWWGGSSLRRISSPAPPLRWIVWMGSWWFDKWKTGCGMYFPTAGFLYWEIQLTFP